MTPLEAERFILANTSLSRPPHTPELQLHLASEAHALWLKTEEELAEIGLPPPFWAFAWAGGQGLARYVLDHPAVVEGRRVFDLASGSGLVALAAVRAGAGAVTANDIDPFAQTALRLNAAANGLSCPAFDARDRVGEPVEADVVLAGDVFYDRAWGARLTPWLKSLAARGTTVLVGDPGRAYLPTGLERLGVYRVPTTRALEDAEVKQTTVWRVTP